MQYRATARTDNTKDVEAHALYRWLLVPSHLSNEPKVMLAKC